MNINEICMNSSVATLPYRAMIMETNMKMSFFLPVRPDSFTAAGYQTLAFIQVLKNQKRLKKQNRQDWKKSGDGTMQNSLTYLLLHLPWPPVWPAQWEMHQENVITADYSTYQKKNNVCSRHSQVQHFPLTHKPWNATAIFWNSKLGKHSPSSFM